MASYLNGTKVRFIGLKSAQTENKTPHFLDVKITQKEEEETTSAVVGVAVVGRAIVGTGG